MSVEYHRSLRLSRSDLVLFLKSKRQFRGVKDGVLEYPKGLEPRSRQKNLDLGTATHLMALEPDRRGEVVLFDGTERGQEWKRFQARNKGKLILNKKAFISSMVMGAAVRCQLGGVLNRAVAEQPIEWTEVVDDVPIEMKALLDIYARNELRVIDVKTTDKSDMQEFRREIRKWRYWMQDAHYSIAVSHDTGCDPLDVDFIFAAIAKGLAAEATARCLVLANEVESVQELEEEIVKRVKTIAPLLCRLHRIPTYERNLALRKRAETLRSYLEAVRTDDWSDPEEGSISECENVVE